MTVSLVIYISVIIITRNQRDLYQEVHGDNINYSNFSLKSCHMSLNLGPCIYPMVKRVNTADLLPPAKPQT